MSSSSSAGAAAREHVERIRRERYYIGSDEQNPLAEDVHQSVRVAVERMDVLPAPETTRDWSELPADALSVVFAKLGAVEVLAGAGLVCHSWLDAAKMPDLWRSVDMLHGALRCLDLRQDMDFMCAMAKVAVDRSGGRLEVFKGEDFVSDELLKYLGDRSPSLKVVSLSCYQSTRISMEGFTELTRKCPLLEDIVFNLWGRDVYGLKPPLVLAELPRLRRLTVGGGISIGNDELKAILDGCPHLDLLDLSSSWFGFHVDDAQLLAKCARIGTLELPASYADEEDDYYYNQVNSRDADLFEDYYSD